MSEAAVLDRSAWLFEPEGPLSETAVARLCADPRFPQAIRTLTSGILALYRGNRFLNALINDRGRMIIGYLALYLHEGAAPDGRGSGFGVGQLKALCAAAGMASPGRTGAMVAMMRMAGYIASASAPDDRRRHILVPTEKLRLAHRDRWTCVAETVRVVNPDAASAFTLGDPDFEAAYVRHTAGYFLDGFRIIDVAPELQLFLDRNAGVMILFSLMLAGEAGDTIPPTRPVTMSISAIAGRFGVSRVHVRTLLRDAEAAGLIARAGENGSRIMIRPELANAAKIFFASIILYVAYCAVEAREEVRRARSTSSHGP
jgi:DNA-binding MarR family transcriptional regulator